MKIYQNFLSENFHFLVVKFSGYLNRYVFVMHLPCTQHSNQPVHPYSLLSLCCLHEETFHPWLFKMYPVKILIDCAHAQAYLTIHWSHMSEGTFSDIDAHNLWIFIGITLLVSICKINFGAEIVLNYLLVRWDYDGYICILLSHSSNVTNLYKIIPLWMLHPHKRLYILFTHNIGVSKFMSYWQFTYIVKVNPPQIFCSIE